MFVKEHFLHREDSDIFREEQNFSVIIRSFSNVFYVRCKDTNNYLIINIFIGNILCQSSRLAEIRQAIWRLPWEVVNSPRINGSLHETPHNRSDSRTGNRTCIHSDTHIARTRVLYR